MATRIYVSDDINILTFEEKERGLCISSRHGDEMVSVLPAELPALLDRLNAAAEAMGVTTKQGELVKACESALHALQILSVGKARDAAIEQLQRVIAKTEAK